MPVKLWHARRTELGVPPELGRHISWAVLNSFAARLLRALLRVTAGTEHRFNPPRKQRGGGSSSATSGLSADSAVMEHCNFTLDAASLLTAGRLAVLVNLHATTAEHSRQVRSSRW